MTLLDRFRGQSRDKHPDPAVRLAFVEELPLSERDMIAAAAREDARSSPQRPKIRIAPEPFPGEPGGVEIEKRPIRLGQVETVVAWHCPLPWICPRPSG